MKSFIFLWLITTFLLAQSCTKNVMYLIGEKFVKLQKYANFTPNDAEFDVRKQYNDVESDDMT